MVLARPLKNVNKLQALEIGRNPLGHGIMALADQLNCLSNLIALNLDDTGMCEKEATAVAQCLSKSFKVEDDSFIMQPTWSQNH